MSKSEPSAAVCPPGLRNPEPNLTDLVLNEEIKNKYGATHMNTHVDIHMAVHIQKNVDSKHR